MISRLFQLVAIVAVSLAATASGQPAATATSTFKMTSTAKLKMRIDGRDVPLSADSVVQYAWKKEAGKRTLSINSISGKLAMGKRELMNGKMDRSRLILVEDGESTEIRFEDAPKELQNLLRAAFDTPLCTIHVDAAGKEIKRTLTVDPAATEIIDKEAVAAATLFHPWYSADKAEWQADVEWGTGHGVATGKLDYAKVAGGKGGQLVRVSGSLAGAGAKKFGEITLTNAKFKIAGEQTYDAARREWIAGKIEAEVKCQLAKGDKTIGEGSGSITVVFEMLPVKR